MELDKNLFASALLTARDSVLMSLLSQCAPQTIVQSIAETVDGFAQAMDTLPASEVTLERVLAELVVNSVASEIKLAATTQMTFQLMQKVQAITPLPDHLHDQDPVEDGGVASGSPIVQTFGLDEDDDLGDVQLDAPQCQLGEECDSCQ